MGCFKIGMSKKKRNKKSDLDPNGNIRNQSWTEIFKYSNGSYIFISEINEPKLNSYQNILKY